MTYFTTLSVSQHLGYIVSDVRMINDLERILKEVLMVSIVVLFWHLSGGGCKKPQLQ
jgi:hypothetical protein